MKKFIFLLYKYIIFSSLIEDDLDDRCNKYREMIYNKNNIDKIHN